MAIPFFRRSSHLYFTGGASPQKKGYTTKLFFILPPHFHPCSESPYSSAFQLLWKQIKKVEAKFASTIIKCYSFSVTYLFTP